MTVEMLRSESVWAELHRTRQRLAELEAEIAESAELESVATAGLAHEISQPLFSIVNFAKATHNVLADQEFSRRGEVEQWLRQIIRSATHAGEIVKRLRGGPGESERRREVVPMKRLILDAVELLQLQLESRQTRVCVSGDETRVRVDAVQIKQVLVNLLQNAMEAMAETPVAQRKIDVTCRLTKGGVWTLMRDRGVGFLGETGELFQPFVTTKTSGTGLGLSISRSIIEAHGGRMIAGPNAGGGAQISFSIPVHVTEVE